jgi:hypothetical protein
MAWSDLRPGLVSLHYAPLELITCLSDLSTHACGVRGISVRENWKGTYS